MLRFSSSVSQKHVTTIVAIFFTQEKQLTIAAKKHVLPQRQGEYVSYLPQFICAQHFSNRHTPGCLILTNRHVRFRKNATDESIAAADRSIAAADRSGATLTLAIPSLTLSFWALDSGEPYAWGVEYRVVLATGLLHDGTCDSPL